MYVNRLTNGQTPLHNRLTENTKYEDYTSTALINCRWYKLSCHYGERKAKKNLVLVHITAASILYSIRLFYLKIKINNTLTDVEALWETFICCEIVVH